MEHTPLPPSSEFVTAQEARNALTEKDPDYGKDFTEKEWGEIAERLSALGRLLWEFSERQVEKGSKPPEEPNGR